jgi:hypothetical protein
LKNKNPDEIATSPIFIENPETRIPKEKKNLERWGQSYRLTNLVMRYLEIYFGT